MLTLIKVAIAIGLSIVVFGAGHIYGLSDALKIINKENERIREIEEKERKHPGAEVRDAKKIHNS